MALSAASVPGKFIFYIQTLAPERDGGRRALPRKATVTGWRPRQKNLPVRELFADLLV
jgi:hypothetical protein